MAHNCSKDCQLMTWAVQEIKGPEFVQESNHTQHPDIIVECSGHWSFQYQFDRLGRLYWHDGRTTAF